MGEFVFHLPRSWLGPLGTGLLPFYQKLTDGLDAAGHSVHLIDLDRETVLQTVAADSATHIVNHGQFEHLRILNAGIAYVYPFWNMDRHGIRAFSSIGQTPFRAADIDAAVARPFFRKLRQRLAVGRTSRYEQPQGISLVPTDCVAIFLQSESHRIVGETCYLSRWEMVEAVLANTSGPVVIKPHPRDKDPETAAHLKTLAQSHPNLTISDANIHDILAVAIRVVTINSAVGIEAYLHRKPVILCGQSDFHHIADVARDPAELARFLNTPARARAYDKFIHWYFGQMCLSTTQADLVDRFLAKAAPP